MTVTKEPESVEIIYYIITTMSQTAALPHYKSQWPPNIWKEKSINEIVVLQYINLNWQNDKCTDNRYIVLKYKYSIVLSLLCSHEKILWLCEYYTVPSFQNFQNSTSWLAVNTSMADANEYTAIRIGLKRQKNCNNSPAWWDSDGKTVGMQYRFSSYVRRNKDTHVKSIFNCLNTCHINH